VAAGPDASEATIAAELLADEPGRLQVLADSAYGTGELLAALADAGHEAIIKPWPIRPPVPGGFTVDDFTVDHAAGIATCPAGHTRPINRSRQVVFGATCRGCPLRPRCTTSRTGRSLKLRDHDALTRAHRHQAADPSFQALYRQHRPMIERSIAWLTRGNRRLRYRGTATNNQWLHTRAAALNLRRLLTLGLTRTANSWTLA
jgi:hypothetical protein